MKRYLLFIISMLCVSIGTWADGGNIDGTTSTWDKTDGVLTLTINGQNHLSGHWNAVTSLDGVNRVKVITGLGVTLTGGVWNSSLAMINGRYYSVPILDLSEADVEVITEGGVPYLKMITDWTSNQEFKNIILPSSLASYLTTLKISQVTRTVPEAIGNSNLYLISGTTVNAVYKNTTSMPSLDTFGSTMRTLKPATDIAGAISFTSVITDAMVTAGKGAGTPYYYTIDLSNVTTAAAGDAPNYTNKITVSADTKVNCLSGDVKNRVTGTNDENIALVDPNIDCTAENLATEVSELTTKGVAAQSVTLTGEITSGVMTTLNSLTSLVRLNLQEATLATGVELNSLAIPSTLEVLVLPKKASDTKSSVTDAMKTHANLKYIYAPFSGTQDKDQMVADYVWVNKPGGLAKAFDEQTRLLSAWYMIVESTVALNDDDVNFKGSDPLNPRVMQYRYLDLSGANITPAVLANYKVTDELPYRIILPNDWTGDMMAVFAANPNKGSIAAVYSYTGTDHKRLDILELNDYAYLPTALNDSRIVRSGTTSIRVVSGHYGNNPVYSKFGDNLLTAINGAASSITSVTIAVGSGIYESVDTNSDSTDDTDQTITGAKTFDFINTNLTDLTLSYLNNQYVTFDIHGCSALQNLKANEMTLKALDASGISTLTTVDFGHSIFKGSDTKDSKSVVDLSGTALTSQLETDLMEIENGTLNVSGSSATSFDFTRLTAKSVNASGTTGLTSLNINGITLNGMTGSGTDDITTDNISNRIGTVEVTRTGGNYSGLTITTASSTEFDTDRIVPKRSDITDDNKKYNLTAIEPSHVELGAAGSSLSSTVPTALTAYNTAQTPAESNTVANIEILHVTGTLTAEDITYIQDYLTGLKLLDLSACTFASGVSVTNITSSTIPTSVAIVLPGTTNTEAGKIADVKAMQDDGYECVAYYTDKTGENKHMNIYATNGTVGNLAANTPKLVNSDSRIAFLPRYANTTVGSVDHQYPEVTPSFLTGLETFVNGSSGSDYVGSVDLTWINISKLGVDFSGLNTYHLVIPQNTTATTVTRNGIVYDNDFTKEDDGTTYSSTDTYKYYKYNANTYAVSTYKGNASPYATQAYFDGESYQYGSGYGQINKTATLTYLRTTGRLGTAYGYMPDLLKNADIITIAGTLDSEDIAQSEYTTSLSDFTNPYIDLTHAQFASTGENPVSNGTWTSFSNSSVKDIAMPYNYATTLAGLPTVGECANLQGIATLVKSDDVLSGSTKKSSLVYKSYKEGGMEGMIPMLHALNLIERQYRITSMTVGGPVVAKDISDRIDGIDANGHLVTTITNGCITGLGAGTQGGALSGYATMESWDLSAATLPNYTSGDNVAEGNRSYRFDNSTHTYATGESGTFSYQNDLAYTYLGIAASTGLTGAILPTDESVWRIADNALNNCKGLVNAELHIPYNYQYIGNGAFLDTYIEHITTTDAAGDLIDNGPNTYTLSANVKEIGNQPTPADASLGANQTVFPQNRPVYDCYVLATDVPKCYKGAFPANMLYGWGGFQGGDFPYCREKYMNGSNYFTVLRFPYREAFTATTGTPDYETMKQRYTDVTKVYTKKEQTGAVDANGDAILWPSFSELRRTYNQATDGITWNDWIANYDSNHEVNGGDQIPTTSQPTGTGEGNNNLGTYTFTGYEGWHQFTLSQATYVKPGEKQDPILYREYVKDDSWYTFCIPFDMTEEDVIALMGVPASTDAVKTTTDTFGDHPEEESSKYNTTAIMPEIRTMKSVTRSPSTYTVNLYTSQDLGTGTYARTYYMPNPSSNEEGTKYVANGTLTIDESTKNVMLRGGYPYLIKPYKLKGTTIGSLGKGVMIRYAFRAIQSAIYHTTSDCWDAFGSGGGTAKFARPYEGHKMQATWDDPEHSGLMNHTDEAHNDLPYNYTFVGQFWKQRMPLHAFYQNSKHVWKHYQTYSDKFYWNPYTCIIMVTDENHTKVEEEYVAKGGLYRDEGNCKYPEGTGALDKDGGEIFDKALEIYYKNGLDDVFTSASARDYRFFFDEDITDFDPDGQATAIDRLNGVDIRPLKGKVYNMSGQHVGNSLEGLSKGMYIVNGRKVVIK